MQVKQSVAWIFVFIMLLGFAMPLASAEEIVFHRPRLPADTPKYDPEKPDALIEDQLYAHSALLIAADTGDVIFEKNPDERMYPASTTKIMTVLLAVMMGDMNDTVVMSDNAVDLPPGSSNAKLKAGEEINLRDLLYVTMIMSANEGATAIAEHISGSEAAFVQLMNEAAQVFGCKDTHFMNAHGLHDPDHYTTARDLAIIAQTAMDYDLFKQIAAATVYRIPKTNLQRERSVSGKTYFLLGADEENKYYYPYGTGIKTGFTNAAGGCFVGAASNDGVNLISVVLYSGQNERYTDTIKLMDYGFSQYVSVTPMELYQMNPIVLESTNFSLDDTNLGRLTLYIKEGDESYGASIVATKDDVEVLARNFMQLVIVNYTRDFAAPITQGEEFGTLTYLPEEGNTVEYKLVASRSIAVRENAPKSIAQIEADTYADPNPFPPLSIELILTLSWPLLIPTAVIILIRTIRKHRKVKLGKLPDEIRRRFR